MLLCVGPVRRFFFPFEAAGEKERFSGGKGDCTGLATLHASIHMLEQLQLLTAPWQLWARAVVRQRRTLGRSLNFDVPAKGKKVCSCTRCGSFLAASPEPRRD